MHGAIDMNILGVLRHHMQYYLLYYEYYTNHFSLFFMFSIALKPIVFQSKGGNISVMPHCAHKESAPYDYLTKMDIDQFTDL